MATTIGNGNGLAKATNIAAASTISGIPQSVTATSAFPNASQQMQEEQPMELKFSLELFNLIKKNENEIENVIISPLLLESMLALLYLGSDGATAQELKNILQLKRFNESNTKMANYYAVHLEMATRESSDTKLQLSQIILLHEQHQMAEEFQRIAKKYFHTNAKTAAIPKSNVAGAGTGTGTGIGIGVETVTVTETANPPSNIQNIENLQNMKNMATLQIQINESLSKISLSPLKGASLIKSVPTTVATTGAGKREDVGTTDATSLTHTDEVNATRTSNGNIIASVCNSGIIETSSSAIPAASDYSKDNGFSDDVGGGGIVTLAANLKSKWFLPFSAYRSGLYDFHSSYKPNQNQNSNSKAANDKSEAFPLPNQSPTPNPNPNQNLNPPPSSIPIPLPKAVPMLFDDDMFVKFGEFRDLDARAIELPFECDVDNELSMLLILPNQRDGGLPTLLEKLKQVDFNDLTDGMQMESVQVLIPKFSLEIEYSLRPFLEQLNLTTIFSKEANFKNLLSSQTKNPVRFSDVIQKFKLVISESGSETSKNQVYKPLALSNSFGSKKKFFRADHPFYFAIRNPDVTYFIGSITNLE